MAIEAMLSAVICGRLGIAHYGEHGHGFAGTGLTDDCEDFAGIDRQTIPCDGHEQAGAGINRQRDFRFREAPSSAPLQLGIERIAQTVADRVDGKDGDENCKTGNVTTHHGALEEFAGIGQHCAPFRRRRLGAIAKEAERGSIEDGTRE